MLEDVLKQITWLGHASIRIDNPSGTIYVDPWKLKSFPPADIILITHEHYDHFSKDDIAKLTTDDTAIISTSAVASQLSHKVKAVQPGESVMVKGIKIEAVAAYNIDKFRSPGIPYHPKADNKLGFIVEVAGIRIYIAGDTDLIPEMAKVRADIALLPVSGTYTMTAAEAAQALRLLKPRIAVPIHYGSIAGAITDAEDFKREAPVEVEVLIPTPE
jgi:L-ascorbate metabolism protein UlaG (beta-lactamase superfamily)